MNIFKKVLYFEEKELIRLLSEELKIGSKTGSTIISLMKI
jgi:hypothetical protein